MVRHLLAEGRSWSWKPVALRIVQTTLGNPHPPSQLQAGRLSPCPHSSGGGTGGPTGCCAGRGRWGIHTPDGEHGLWEPAHSCPASCCSYFPIPDDSKVCDGPTSKGAMKHIPQAEGSPAMIWGPASFSPEQSWESWSLPAHCLLHSASTQHPKKRGGWEAGAGFGPGTGPAMPL